MFFLLYIGGLNSAFPYYHLIYFYFFDINNYYLNKNILYHLNYYYNHYEFIF